MTTTTSTTIRSYTCPKCHRTTPWEGAMAVWPQSPSVCICTECHNAEEAEAAGWAAAAEVEKREAAWKALCPPLYQQTDPARLPDQIAYHNAMSFSYSPVGLLLVGPTGGGKSRIAWEWLRRAWDEGKSISAFTAVEFSHECGKRFFDGSGEAWIGQVSRAKVLFIDDIGKGRLTDRGESELFGLVEYRTSHLLPIVATMNLSGAGLADRLSEDRGAPLVRRLKEFCKVLIVKGKEAGK